MSDTSTVLPEKATHRRTRTFNQQLVLRALHDDSPLSRADLARLTGLTRTSVSDLVGSLIDDRAAASHRSCSASPRKAVC
jgi:DNA-binding MarR family transcriptional regulator